MKNVLKQTRGISTRHNLSVRSKDSTAGITLIALVITIIVLLILAGVTIATLTGDNGILTQAGNAATQTDIAGVKEQIQLEIVAKQIEGDITEKEYKAILEKYGTLEYSRSIFNGTLTTAKGNKILVADIFNGSNLADGRWSDSEGVNTPLLVDGLTAVTFNSDGSVKEVSDSNYVNWYDYANGEWANAVTKDSSGNITGYWVWIPRFEYKINSSSKTTTVKFIPMSQTTVDSDYDHIHPAFCDGSLTNYINGEWDSEISGFWVAKFPAGWQQNTITDNSGTLSTTISNSTNTLVLSSSNYTYTSSYSTVAVGNISTSTAMSLPVFLPLTYAYNCISIGDSYTLAQQVTRSSNSSSFYGLSSSSTDSHMLKNSEWGAVAYLTQSQYGRNGTEPNINNYFTSTESPYRVTVTGVYTNATSTSSTKTITNESAWYTSTGQLGSSTGNMTGVYDLNGCVWERVAGYISNGDANLSTYAGSSGWVNTTVNVEGNKTLSKKYYTVYPYNSSSDTAENNWTEYSNLKSTTYGYGDAILETSTAGAESSSWYSDHSRFARTDGPFFFRGGWCNDESSAGAFAFTDTAGSQLRNGGFRVVLVCK